MSETFVPLVPAKADSRDLSFTPILFKGSAPKGAASSPNTATLAKPAGAEPQACSKPVVTLQRNGDVVAGIRIQCGCGQVVDLSCVY